MLYKINPFNWEDEFPFLEQKKGFDAIIGNPPYIRIQNLVKHFPEEIDYYRSSFSSYSVGKKDIFDKYYLFIEKAIELINPNGIIGYIIPHKFFVIKGGKKLRSSIISQCNFYKIVHFGVTQVFLGRQTYTAIVIFGKQKKDKFTFKRITNLINKSSFDVANTNEYIQNKYSDSPWLFLTKKAELLFEKIKLKNVIPLKNIAKILVGLQTSCDKVYIVHLIKDNGRTVTVSNDDKPNAIVFEIEKEIPLPCLYDLQLDLFDTPKPNSYIIFPYLINRDQASVYSESQMKKNFPLCWQYLNSYKIKLLKRDINGNDPKWYQYGRSQNLTSFHNIDKLIWKVLSKEASYTYDNSNIQFTGGGNGPYYSLTSKNEYSLFYILAILSHPLIEAMVKSGASEFKGAFYSHGKQFIENLPIRVIDCDSNEDVKIYYELVEITQKILEIKEKINTNNNPNKRKILCKGYAILRKDQINLINSLYDVSQDEILEIEGDKLFFAELNEES